MIAEDDDGATSSMNANGSTDYFEEQESYGASWWWWTHHNDPKASSPQIGHDGHEPGSQQRKPKRPLAKKELKKKHAEQGENERQGFSKWAVATQAVMNDLDPIRQLRELASLHYQVQKSGSVSEVLGDVIGGSVRPGQQAQGHSAAVGSTSIIEHDTTTDTGTSRQLRTAGGKDKKEPQGEQSGSSSPRTTSPILDRTHVYEWTHGSSFSPTSFSMKPVPTWNQWYHWLAPHGAELDFLWGSALDRGTESEQNLSRLFMRYFANFAYTGNPMRGPHRVDEIDEHMLTNGMQKLQLQETQSADSLSKSATPTSSTFVAGGPGGDDDDHIKMNDETKKTHLFRNKSNNYSNKNIDNYNAIASPSWPSYSDFGGSLVIENMSSIIADETGPRGGQFRFWRNLLRLPNNGAWPADFLNPES
ncbi:unnamed protein product [Amoebophrya sp. A25]|nr:unnamed protein product [Amoebophrya sp. A25]|eukprot:GSA25T00003990001.1